MADGDVAQPGADPAQVNVQFQGQHASYNPQPQQGYPQPPPGGHPQQGYPQPPPGGHPQQGYPPQQGGYPPPQQQHPVFPPQQQQPGFPPQQQQPGAAPFQPFQSGQPFQGGPPPPGAGAGELLPLPTPPLDSLASIEGYHGAMFDTAHIAPPPPYVEPQRTPDDDEEAKKKFKKLQAIGEGEARDAMISFVTDHCCWGSGVARDMDIIDIKYVAGFHYQLETFTEKRTTNRAFAPHPAGEFVDGPQYGPAPLPWMMPAPPIEKLFQNQNVALEVPHTSSVTMCHRCHGSGNLICKDCDGRCFTQCFTCHGTGTRYREHEGHQESYTCSTCEGRGERRCHDCQGRGRVTCETCEGYKQIRCFIQLKITWINHEENQMIERTELPDELIKGVEGVTAFEEEASRIWPITYFPDSEVNEKSIKSVQKHTEIMHEERLIMQRHRVRVVPVNEVKYRWKERHEKYFVYGLENKVYHHGEYPQECCWGCEIL